MNDDIVTFSNYLQPSMNVFFGQSYFVPFQSVKLGLAYGSGCFLI